MIFIFSIIADLQRSVFSAVQQGGPVTHTHIYIYIFFKKNFLMACMEDSREKKVDSEKSLKVASGWGPGCDSPLADWL